MVPEILTTHSKNDLERLLGKELASARKAVVIGGHYPLAIDEVGAVYDAVSDGCFGAFCMYTFDLAAKLAAEVTGADTSIALIVDDHSQMPERDWYLKERSEFTFKNIAQHFENYQFPRRYLSILESYGLTLDAMIPAKESRAFQESKYRRAFMAQYGIMPSCAGEITMILNELRSAGVDTVVGFIPLVCEGPSCTAAKYVTRETGGDLRFTTVHLPSYGVMTDDDMDRYIATNGVTVRHFGAAL